MKEFLLCMALCHTVHVNKDQGGDEVDAPNANEDYTQWQYEASSPDEKALVEAARRSVTCREHRHGLPLSAAL